MYRNRILSFVKRNGYAAMVYWLALAMPAGLCQERPSKDTNASPVKVPLASPAGEVVHPVRVSENGRYLVDQRGRAVFWLGTTQWELFRGYTLDDARIILESAKARGFAFVQVKLLGGGDGTKPNVYGEKPLIDDNPLTPNEAYFKNVDAVVEIARENNVAISLNSVPSTLAPGHHDPECARVGEMDRHALQERAHHCLVDDAKG